MEPICLAYGTPKEQFKRILDFIMNYNSYNTSKISWFTEIVLEYYVEDELAEIKKGLVHEIFKELLDRQIQCDIALREKY